MDSLLTGAAAGAFLLGVAVGWWLLQMRARQRRQDAESQAAQILAAADADVERIRQAAELAGREEAFHAKQEWEREETRRREELDRAESRIEERRNSLDQKYDMLVEKDRQVEQRQKELDARAAELASERAEVQRLRGEADARVEAVAGMSQDEARRMLVQQMEEHARAEAANTIREIRETAKREADRESRNILALAIQRIAADHTAESTVSVVSLPSDEMKGRIIGREGRNIRAFEQATGVDVIIDDTPEAVILSGFDPIRREAARIALDKLIADGRIHPARIEEVVARARKEVDEGMLQAAEEVCYELGVHGIHPEVLKVLGRLKYRTSYGQNQLLHAKEVALVSGNMAAEMKLDVTMTKRMALLHDVGKGLTHEHEGTHVELGWNLCRKFNEPDQVLNAIKAHHDEEPHRYAETFLVTAADAVSGARPGARREMLETYVKRLEKLEEIATGFSGVERCFAIQAGREVRVMVNPEDVTDQSMTELSENIARKLEEELQYPGQIKVIVIRETRAVDFAR
ncbi:MAG TPA: ribonuclease Y [Longimicrobiales bacterium]|nr:ribonuclease Y [Longimicrobiales bacterium]